MQYEDHDGKRYAFPVDAADVTAQMLDLAEQVHGDWFDNDESIDWDDFLDRMATYSLLDDEQPWEFDETDNAAVRKIQRHIRALRRNG